MFGLSSRPVGFLGTLFPHPCFLCARLCWLPARVPLSGPSQVQDLWRASRGSPRYGWGGAEGTARDTERERERARADARGETEPSRGTTGGTTSAKHASLCHVCLSPPLASPSADAQRGPISASLQAGWSWLDHQIPVEPTRHLLLLLHAEGQDKRWAEEKGRTHGWRTPR